MGQELKSSYYDDSIGASEKSNVHYSDTPYYVLYTQVLQFLKEIPNAKILEIGCGTGQFAHYLYDQGFKNYIGFDFSPKRVELATARVHQKFFVGNAFEVASYEHDYNVVIALEVLEHVDNDFEILDHLREGSKIIFSLPSFDDVGHVRWFTNKRQIKRRYFTLIDIKHNYLIEAWFAVSGELSKYDPSWVNRLLATRCHTNAKYFYSLWKRLISAIHQYLRI